MCHEFICLAEIVERIYEIHLLNKNDCCLSPLACYQKMEPTPPIRRFPCGKRERRNNIIKIIFAFSAFECHQMRLDTFINVHRQTHVCVCEHKEAATYTEAPHIDHD